MENELCLPELALNDILGTNQIKQPLNLRLTDRFLKLVGSLQAMIQRKISKIRRFHGTGLRLRLYSAQFGYLCYEHVLKASILNGGVTRQEWLLNEFKLLHTQK